MSIITQWTRQHVQDIKKIEGYWKRLARRAKGKTNRAYLWMILAVVIYCVWKARNEAWYHRIPRPQVVCHQIQQECKIRYMYSAPQKQSMDRRWINDILDRVAE
ncbi:hypothetical protein R3W88_012170 [Solanum pinnatisectum]|uniref:Uncharacterized protein n=1 Tax=Solanum pinnatisectum TaxID=50273 RepID=A0AAV9L9I5_9SOLN|nr:hypothetical protein R3W88_012170 [Solanum pinnatisectum]